MRSKARLRGLDVVILTNIPGVADGGGRRPAATAAPAREVGGRGRAASGGRRAAGGAHTARSRPSQYGSRSRRLYSLPLGSRGIAPMKSTVLGRL